MFIAHIRAQGQCAGWLASVVLYVGVIAGVAHDRYASHSAQAEQALAVRAQVQAVVQHLLHEPREPTALTATYGVGPVRAEPASHVTGAVAVLRPLAPLSRALQTHLSVLEVALAKPDPDIGEYLVRELDHADRTVLDLANAHWQQARDARYVFVAVAVLGAILVEAVLLWVCWTFRARPSDAQGVDPGSREPAAAHAGPEDVRGRCRAATPATK